MRKIKTLFVALFFLLTAVAISAAYDPFAPKNEITLWLDADSKKLESAKSFLAQSGFLAVTGNLRGKALVTNLDYLSPLQIEEIETFLAKGGKLILLGTKNFGEITFFGKQYVGEDLFYLEIVDPTYTQSPKVFTIPKNAAPISVIAEDDRDSVLAEYLLADGTSKSHIDLLNSAVLKTRWGLYSGFDWFDGAFLEDPAYRQLFMLWLRKTIWS
ncbi:MAG: hypothetical protein PHD88_03250 [Firmicutes bacterium]|nr:hypothetical protein [Bacillota bacterium]MDD4263469.1 hypothetical protein [Bacillota bacterium]MDD4693407.1 hypothetical protein [Bacillota bacterium]